MLSVRLGTQNAVRLSYVVSNMRNEMKCLSVSVKRGFQYEEWNEMYVRLSYVDSNIRNDKKYSRLSYVVSNMRNEMKCCLSVSVIHGFQYEEWNEMYVRLSYVDSNMRNDKMYVRLSYVVSNMRNEM